MSQMGFFVVSFAFLYLVIPYHLHRPSVTPMVAKNACVWQLILGFTGLPGSTMVASSLKY